MKLLAVYAWSCQPLGTYIHIVDIDRWLIVCQTSVRRKKGGKPGQVCTM